METQLTHKPIDFHGKGSRLFSIQIINLLLTAITLGFYYPWARAAKMQYMYSQTEFFGNRFQFHGTGKEMFKGYIKALCILLVLFIVLFAGTLHYINPFIGLVIFYTGIILVTPLAIYGAVKYRTSRSSWRGIHFGYRGTRRNLFNKYYKGIVLSLITFGLYSPWFINNLRKEVINNIRLGNVQFKYTGEGKKLFFIYLKGILLLLPTFGLYQFWLKKNTINYLINNIEMEQNGEVLKFQSRLTAGAIFETAIINALIIVFTFGLGTPWAIIRETKMIISHMDFAGVFNAETVAQTETEYKNATGDDLTDMLDLNVI